MGSYEPYPSYSEAATKGLSVFMPVVHARRAAGVAASLSRGGHRMFVSGETSVAPIAFEYRYSARHAKAAFGSNVSVYEGDDLFSDPPDVIIVGREDNEADSFAIWNRISAYRPVVLCAYSGVFQSRFAWSAYRGVICCDLPSRAVARYFGIPALRYRPIFAEERFPYTPFEDRGLLPLRSYINGMTWRFPRAHALLAACRDSLAERFGDRVEVENVDGLPPAAALEKMRSSAMTLHIKDEEGFGWSILESLATGRPLIVQEGLARNMAFNDWIVPGVTGFTFRGPEDLTELVASFLESPEKLANSQKRAAAHLREAFDGGQCAEELGRFLLDLWKMECARWFPGRTKRECPAIVMPYEASFDPAHLQHYELHILQGQAEAAAAAANQPHIDPGMVEAEKSPGTRRSRFAGIVGGLLSRKTPG